MGPLLGKRSTAAAAALPPFITPHRTVTSTCLSMLAPSAESLVYRYTHLSWTHISTHIHPHLHTATYPQELVREEAKVAVAAHTEAKAKQVAEVVAEVARAKQEVAVVKAEASGQAETLVRTAQVRAGWWCGGLVVGQVRSWRACFCWLHGCIAPAAGAGLELKAISCGYAPQSTYTSLTPAAPQALNSSVAMGGWRNRQEEKGKATTELVQAHSRVDQQVQKLENVTASLGATALRMRNETATSKATAKAAGSYIATAQHQQQEKDDAQQAQQQQQTEAAQQQQQQQEETAEQQHEASAGGGVGGGEGNGGSTAHEGVVRAAEKAVATLVGGEASTAAGKGGGAASAAHEGVVRAAEAAVATLVQKTRQQALPEGGKAGSSSGSGGDDDAAEALEKVAGAANETLTAVKESKVALEAAAAEAATKGKTKAQVRDGARRGAAVLGNFWGVQGRGLHPCWDGYILLLLVLL